MWPGLHSRDGTGTGTAFPSSHSLPCAGNIFPSRSRRQGHLEGWPGSYPCWENTATSWLLVPSLHCSRPTSARLPLGPRAAHAYCRLPMGFKVSPGLYRLPQPAPVTSQPSPPPSACPHLRPLTPHPSWSTPGLPLPQAFCAPAFPSVWAAGRSCPGELDSSFLISFRSLLRWQGITLGEACSSHPFFFF